MSDEKKLSQEELLWKIYASTERTRKYILWGKILSIIFLAITVLRFVVLRDKIS